MMKNKYLLILYLWYYIFLYSYSLRYVHFPRSLHRIHSLGSSSNIILDYQSKLSLDEEKILRKLISNNKAQEASIIISQLNSSKLQSGRNIVYVITETSRRSFNYQIILPLLQSIPIESFQCTENDIMPLLCDCAEHQNMKIIQPIINYLNMQNIKFSAKAFSVMIKGFGNQKSETMVDKVIEWCDHSRIVGDIVLFNSVLDAYINCGNNEKAKKLFSIIESSNINPKYNKIIEELHIDFLIHSNITTNVRSWNILLKCYRNDLNDNSIQQCLQVIDKMKANNILPNIVTVNTLIDVCVLSNKLQYAEELLENNYDGIAPGIEAYTSVIAGFASRSDSIGAFRILDLMQKRKIVPNSYTLTSLMTACLSSKQIVKAKQLLTTKLDFMESNLTKIEMIALHGSYVVGICRLYNQLWDSDVLSNELVNMNALQKLRDYYLYEAQLALIEMEQKSILPDILTLNSFIQSLCIQNPSRVLDALTLLPTMQLMKIIPDDFTYSILFNALGKIGYLDETIQLYNRLLEEKQILDTSVINALLRAFVNSKNPMYAIKLFNEINNAKDVSIINTSDKFEPDKITFTILFLAIAKYISLLDNEYDNISTANKILYNKDIQRKSVTSTFNLKPITIENLTPLLSQYQKLNIIEMSINHSNIDIDNKKNTTYDNNNKVITSNDLYNDKKYLSMSNEYQKNIDSIVINLYKIMKETYRIEIDHVMLKTLNSLFHNMKNINNNIFFNTIEFNINDKFIGFSKETSRYIFEDLVISGIHPKEILNILYSCKFSKKKENSFLYDNELLIKIRASATSFRIFKKYGWNEVNSGWSSLF